MPLVMVQPKIKYVAECAPAPTSSVRTLVQGKHPSLREFVHDNQSELATSEFKDAVRWPVLVLVAVIRFFTGVQLVLVGLMHLIVSPRQVVLLQMWTTNNLVGVVYVSVGAAMLVLCMSMLVKPRRHRKQKAIESTRPWKRKVLLWRRYLLMPVSSSQTYRWCTSHDSSVLIWHCVATVTHLCQAYRLSSLVLQADIVVGFACLIGLGALAVPFCLRQSLVAMQATGVLTVNVVVSFVLSIVFPFCIVQPTIAKYLSSGVYGLLFTNEEFVVNVFSARQAAVSSLGDLITKLCPIVAMHHTMRNLTIGFGPPHHVPRHVHHLKEKTTMSTISEAGEPSTTSGSSVLLLCRRTLLKYAGDTSRRPIQVSTGRTPQQLPTHITAPTPSLPSWTVRQVPKRLTKRCNNCSIVDGAPMTLDNQVFVRRFVSFHVVLGVVVMGLAVYSYATRPRCPAYCAQHVAPWFASTCGCIYVNVDCAKLNISGSTSDMEGMLTADTIGSSVFWVQIANCDVANGLSPRTMQQLPALYGISLWQTHLSDWTMPETVWPAQLTKISLQHSPHLTEVPQVLSPLPSSVQVLFLVGCGITELSNSTVQSWRRLRQLWISQLPITTLPPSIATLEMLDGLRLNNNRLVSFSVDTIRTMATLEVLSLSSNNLTLLPWGKRAIETDVADNPIATLPRELSVDFLATGVVTVASTVFCAVQLKQNPTKWATICHPLCAPHCSSQLVGNGLCDVSCLVPQCDYDGGDCNEFFAPGDGQ